ncbi:MAG TPA: DUF4365 domain-containing protein, partial [Thermoanaerobaculia bacterium]|nr:DUF4365 domain-containing protein [Thermoanaerobaculia bacterium]
DNPNPTEDLGYAFVYEVAAKGGAIWRQQPTKDLGVDGVIELQRDDGTSAYIGVQVKSGVSYFRRAGHDSVRIDNMGPTLRRLVKLNIPAIVVVYHPEKRCGYWENVKDFVLKNPDCLDRGYIDIPFRSFDAQTFSALRADARMVFAPRIAREEVREFLGLNNIMTFPSVVLLAKAVLNHRLIPLDMGWDIYRQLLAEDIIEIVPEVFAWKATAKGKRYVEFLLGSRYYLPDYLLDSPLDFISEEEIDLCTFFDYLQA